MSRSIGAFYRRIGQRTFTAALEQNDRNIEQALAASAPRERLLDLGCDDGARTMRYAAAARATSVHGVEIVEHRARLARERGVNVAAADLGARLPFDDRSFDAVVSNQVIEHVFDTDLFLEEACRLLRPGGLVVTSTENLASWHNVGALVLGWQPFSLTNASSYAPIGNPLGLAVGGEIDSIAPDEPSWQHRRVFAARALLDLHRAIGFQQVQLAGAGYYPLPGRIAQIRPAHAAFITVSGVRT